MKLIAVAILVSLLGCVPAQGATAGQKKSECWTTSEFVNYPEHATRSVLETYAGVRGVGVKDTNPKFTNSDQVSILYPECDNLFPYEHVRVNYIRDNKVAYYVAWIQE